MYKLLPILLFAYSLAVTTEDIYDNSYALIIGIDKYQNVRSLDYAVKDAEAIESMLLDNFHFQKNNIVLLKNEEATKTSIIQEFSNITNKARANDRVLIFFAGHGVTQDLPDGGEMGYLMPVNGDETNLYVSAIGMDELKKISLISEAKHMLFLVDACYGGIISVGARSLEANTTPDYLDKITKNKSRQIISAGGRGEEVIEKAEWGHSAFTKNLLSGLRDSKADTDNDGIITAQELGTYLKKKVTIDSNNQQTPKTRYLTTDEGEFVFSKKRKVPKYKWAEEDDAYDEDVAGEEQADAKLDYLILAMEELKSQKSNYSITEEEPIDEEEGYYEKYGYERRAIGFFAYEDVYSIAFSEDIDKNRAFTIMYMKAGKNTIKKYITSHNSYSLSANLLGFSVGYKYPFNDVIMPFIVSGAAYMMTSWEDMITKISGDKNIILFSVGGGVTVFPLQYEQPFPMDVSISIGFTGTYLPTSHEVNDEIVTLEDWKINLMPAIVLFFGIPK